MLPREQVQIASKFGISMSDTNQVQVKGNPEYVRRCIEASLKRLDMNYIDLYYQHRVDTSVPIEETMGELKKLVEEGKIRYIGLSEASVDTIKRAHAVHPITAVQMEYSLWSREIEEDFSSKTFLYSSSTSSGMASPSGDDVVPIPGTTKMKNLEDNIGSLAVKLRAEELKEIDAAIPIDEVGGERDYAIFSKYSYRLANTPEKK
ncbi:hypothetical protein DH2020_019904 [Rehmannia glutinosa]|uniref:NADP-dependent oxidoreductase domain-containing protein n=1 Tax=Rehmannia glutinosa TaxID=99300 RepID=A0ABR0WIS7_REHGL